MSWLSKITGIGISPHGVKIDPLKALGTVAGLATGGIGGAAIGALKSGALGAIGHAIGGQDGQEVAGAIPDAAMGIHDSGGLSGLLGKAGDFITGNGGRNALGVAQGINAAMQQRKSGQLANEALAQARSSYAERAPLRAQGLQQLMNPQTQDLTPLRAVMSQGNPYAGVM